MPTGLSGDLDLTPSQLVAKWIGSQHIFVDHEDLPPVRPQAVQQQSVIRTRWDVAGYQPDITPDVILRGFQVAAGLCLSAQFHQRSRVTLHLPTMHDMNRSQQCPCHDTQPAEKPIIEHSRRLQFPRRDRDRIARHATHRSLPRHPATGFIPVVPALLHDRYRYLAHQR